MAQKNELMQTYIKNGVTSLDDMKNHFNSFALGGDKDNPDNPPASKIPTLNEYLAQRATEEQEQYYLQGSRNRNESVPIVYHTKKQLTREGLEEANRANRAYEIRQLLRGSELLGIPISSIIKFYNNNVYPIGYEDSTNSNAGYTRLNYAYDKKLYTKENDRRLKENDLILYEDVNGFNCIATATSNNPNPGHYTVSNVDFRENVGKYGFKEVNEKDIKPGGIIQQRFGDLPTHAVILDNVKDGIRRVNYSPGEYPFYHKNVEDWSNSAEEYYYNFVGNSADSTRWINEYEQLYGKHKLGGYLFATSGPKDPSTVLSI